MLHKGSQVPLGADPDSSQEIAVLPVLGQIFQHGTYIRLLSLGILEGDSYIVGNLHEIIELDESDREGSLTSYIQNQDSLSARDELAGLIRNRNLYHSPGYDLTKPQCIAWKKAMNWKPLIKLDLWNSRITDFFMIFRGSLPQLKSLTFRLTLGPESNDDPTLLLRLTTQSLDSIQGLEELVIIDWTKSSFLGVSISIARHGHTFRSHEVNPSERLNRSLPGWAVEPLIQLLQTVPKLRNLALAIEAIKSPGYWSFGILAWVRMSLPTLYNTLY